MPRPSRLDEAKEQLRVYYAEHGGMPSIQVFAGLMGYASTSSAHDVTNALVRQGFLAKDDRAKRLLPGVNFARKVMVARTAPPELVRALPRGVVLSVVAVDQDLDVQAVEGILESDYLVVAPPERADLSSLLLLVRGSKRRVASQPLTGWRTEGVVVAQFRSYTETS